MDRTSRTTTMAVFAVVLGGLLLFLGACAKSKIERSQSYVQGRSLPRPPVLLVYDFAVNADDVVADTFGPKFLTGAGKTSKRVEVGREVQQQLAVALVAKLQEKGIQAQRANLAEAPPLHALLAKGQFWDVSEGDAMGRTVIGFGMGSSKVRVQVQVYQMTAQGPRRLSEGVAKATGSKKPGMAVPVAGGAAAGAAATSAVISGGLSATSEIRAKIRPDVERLAELLSERAVEFYHSHGWM